MYKSDDYKENTKLKKIDIVILILGSIQAIVYFIIGIKFKILYIMFGVAMTFFLIFFYTIFKLKRINEYQFEKYKKNYLELLKEYLELTNEVERLKNQLES